MILIYRNSHVRFVLQVACECISFYRHHNSSMLYDLKRRISFRIFLNNILYALMTIVKIRKGKSVRIIVYFTCLRKFVSFLNEINLIL
jgi:hypothetical protein